MKKLKKRSPMASAKKLTRGQVSESDLKQVAGGRKAGGRPLEYIKMKAGAAGDITTGIPTGMKVY